MQSNRRHEPRHHESRRFARRVRRRFWAALALTVPILLLSPPIQGVLGIKEALQLAAGAESRSEHPIAQGIVDAVDDAPAVEDFNAITGKGAEGRVDGKNVKIVSPGYLREYGIEIPDARHETLSGQGKTVVFVLIDGDLAGAIALVAGVLVGWGIVFGPAVGAALMSLSTVIVAINARFLNVDRSGNAT